MPRKRGGRGVIRCKDGVRTEENSTCWYVKNSNEEMLMLSSIILDLLNK